MKTKLNTSLEERAKQQDHRWVAASPPGFAGLSGECMYCELHRDRTPPCAIQRADENCNCNTRPHRVNKMNSLFSRISRYWPVLWER